jgi:hypothetical protein
MTEGDWDTCTDVLAMLEWLGGSATSRKRRLFGCACCRRVWEWLPDERSRRAVEVAERFADGLVGEEERRMAHRAAEHTARALRRTHSPGSAPRAAAADAAVWVSHKSGALIAGALAGKAENPGRPGGYGTEVLRDLFANPFRRPPAVEPAWLAWDGGAVRKLAQAIYDGGRFADLPVLADALEEAGCDSPEVLRHCRGGGGHVRGCWLLDLLLDKS